MEVRKALNSEHCEFQVEAPDWSHYATDDCDEPAAVVMIDAEHQRHPLCRKHAEELAQDLLADLAHLESRGVI